MSGPVTYRILDQIAWLTLDDGKANALHPTMSRALGNALDRAADEAAAVILLGRPGIFCAGFDLTLLNGPEQGREEMITAGAQLLLQCYLYPKPLIVACSGHAVAAGALLALTGDYRLASAGDFRIGLNETAIGWPLPVFGQVLARDRLAHQALTQAVLNATLYDPDAARHAGFIDEVVPAESLTARAHGAANTLRQLDPEAFARTKRALREPAAEQIRRSLRP